MSKSYHLYPAASPGQNLLYIWSSISLFSTKEKQQLRIVVQNIEDDLYCSQLNISHCFKNFLCCHFVPDPPALVRVLVTSDCADCNFLSWFVFKYGWHLKWIVEHALDSEAKKEVMVGSQWTTGFGPLTWSLNLILSRNSRNACFNHAVGTGLTR